MKVEVRRYVSSFVMVAVLAAVGCAKPGAVPPPEQMPGKREPYVIGIPDVLNISVWKNAELGLQVPVRSDGKISVPLLDDVQAEGLTPEELKEVLTEALSEYISAPDVTVIVLQPNSQTVTVVGALVRSGSLPLQKETTVLEAIAAMGGFSTWAKKNDVRILRPNDNGFVSYRFNYGAYLAGKAPGSNMFLESGDTVVVPD